MFALPRARFCTIEAWSSPQHSVRASTYFGRLTVALRELTKEERDTARRKALAARVERAELKQEFGSGAISFDEVLQRAGGSEAVARLKTLELLESLPGVGRVTATKVLEDLGISVNRRLGGLGVKQRRALKDYLAELG